jgi:hypothetical protein
MTTVRTATASRWCGWHRPRSGTWCKIVRDAATAADCWAALLAAVAKLPSGDSCVLESFRRPDAPSGGSRRGGRRMR